MQKVAVVPVKEKSDRVISKNFRPFADDLSLFELKLKQLVAANCFDKIFVSSDSSEAERIAKKYNVDFIFRDERFCNNIISWSDVIHHVVDSLPVEDDTVVAWVHTTSPFFFDFQSAVKAYDENVNEAKYDGLVTVSDFKEFLVTDKSRPYNYNWGVWHDYSQDLDPLYRVTGALFMAKKALMIKHRYVMSHRPFLHVTSDVEGIDIDTDFDFKMAQLIHNNRKELGL